MTLSKEQRIIDLVFEIQEKIEELRVLATEGTHWSDDFIAIQYKVADLICGGNQ